MLKGLVMLLMMIVLSSCATSKDSVEDRCLKADLVVKQLSIKETFNGSQIATVVCGKGE